MKPFFTSAMVFPIRIYRFLISPWLGARCRFEPSCSHYAEDAIRTHGAVKGALLAGRRLLRCHPFGGSGYDPVPQHLYAGQKTGEPSAREAEAH